MIITTVDVSEFQQWLGREDSSYHNRFSYEGAEALFNYLEELSKDIGKDSEFDPVAWCCEFAEYKDLKEFLHDTGYTKDGTEYDGYDDIKTLDDLKDRTTVIEFESGIVVKVF